jgi:hypothetical protein
MGDIELIPRGNLVKISVYDMSTGTFVPMLRSLSQILDKAVQQASDK